MLTNGVLANQIWYKESRSPENTQNPQREASHLAGLSLVEAIEFPEPLQSNSIHPVAANVSSRHLISHGFDLHRLTSRPPSEGRVGGDRLSESALAGESPEVFQGNPQIPGDRGRNTERITPDGMLQFDRLQVECGPTDERTLFLILFPLVIPLELRKKNSGPATVGVSDQWKPGMTQVGSDLPRTARGRETTEQGVSPEPLDHLTLRPVTIPLLRVDTHLSRVIRMR